MNALQSFLLIVFVLIAGVVLILTGHGQEGVPALGAAIAGVGLHTVNAAKGGSS